MSTKHYNRDSVFKALCDGQATVKEIALKTGISRKIVTDHLTSLHHEGKVFIVGRINRSENIWNVKPAYLSFYELKKIYSEPSVKPKMNYQERAFSNDEMHYGRGGKKWSWRDVVDEAASIRYEVGSYINKLPFKQVL